MAGNTTSYAYCTLITRSSYLAGVVILAHTLVKYKSAHPLIVLYTDGLSADSIRALEAEAPKLNLILRRIDALLPRKNVHVHLIAERFADTWTKLRVFQLHETDPQFTTLCYLDADMIVRQNMDHVFGHAKLPADDWIAANHACVCNLDHDPWAPEDWTKENCAYTCVNHPEALTSPTPVKPDSIPVHHLLNSGMFVFKPSEHLWGKMLDFFNTTPLLGEFKFPDQDFLATFFSNKWISIGWQFNALKTMRYWHPNIWRDEEVVCLHYIVDKPWAKRVGEDGKAGYLGRDGVTHTWWWEEHDEWRQRLETESGMNETLQTIEQYTDSKGIVDSADMRAIGASVQAFATNKKNDGDETKDTKENDVPQSKQQNDDESDENEKHDDVGSTHLRKKVLGEHGHGPRLRGAQS